MDRKSILDTIEDQPFTTTFSTIVSGTLYSKSLKMDWNYAVYLPLAALSEPNHVFPVLYLLHGLYGNYRNYLERIEIQKMLDQLQEAAEQPFLVVFVEGFNSFYLNQTAGLQMESAVMQDLLPWIENEFPVATDRKRRAVGGISMGGYGAARFGLKFPAIFGYACLISPAVWQLENTEICRQLHAFNDGRKNWSDEVYQRQFPQVSGECNPDFFVMTTRQDSVVPWQDVEQFVGGLQKHQVLVEFQLDEGFDHNWQYWQQAVETVCQWLLEKWK